MATEGGDVRNDSLLPWFSNGRVPLVVGLTAAVTVLLTVSLLAGFVSADPSFAGGTDSSGDRLPDAWKAAGETPAGAPVKGDPGRKTLHVVVVYGAGVEPLTDEEKAALEEIWASMPVENPDGSTGIDIVIDDSPPHGGRADEPLRFNNSAEAREVGERVYRERMGDRRCVYHLAVLGDVDSRTNSAWGNAPGYTVAVDGHETDYYGSQYTWRVRVLTHELLHNIVGTFEAGHAEGDPFHTNVGWLSHHYEPERSQFLSQPTAAQLNESGFADTPYYDRNVCS